MTDPESDYQDEEKLIIQGHESESITSLMYLTSIPFSNIRNVTVIDDMRTWFGNVINGKRDTNLISNMFSVLRNLVSRFERPNS